MRESLSFAVIGVVVAAAALVGCVFFGEEIQKNFGDGREGVEIHDVKDGGNKDPLQRVCCREYKQSRHVK